MDVLVLVLQGHAYCEVYCDGLVDFLEVENGWLLCSQRVLEASKTEDKTLEVAFLYLGTFGIWL